MHTIFVLFFLDSLCFYDKEIIILNDKAPLCFFSSICMLHMLGGSTFYIRLENMYVNDERKKKILLPCMQVLRCGRCCVDRQTHTFSHCLTFRLCLLT